MRLLALLLALLLSAPACALRAYHLQVANKPVSVRPLVWIIGEQPHEVCTTFSINQQAGFWVTAYHCTPELYGQDYEMQIDGQPAVIAFSNPQNDAVVLRSTATAPALRLAPEAPAVGTPIVIVGYPHGLVVYRGKTQEPYVEDGITYGAYTALVEKGTSGGPVISARGVVGTLNWTFGPKSEREGTAGTAWAVFHALVEADIWASESDPSGS